MKITLTPQVQEDMERGGAPRLGLQVLAGMAQSGKHVYGGTVPAATIARRRAANRRARVARRANR